MQLHSCLVLGQNSMDVMKWDLQRELQYPHDLPAQEDVYNCNHMLKYKQSKQMQRINIPFVKVKQQMNKHILFKSNCTLQCNDAILKLL